MPNFLQAAPTFDALLSQMLLSCRLEIKSGLFLHEMILLLLMYPISWQLTLLIALITPPPYDEII